MTTTCEHADFDVHATVNRVEMPSGTAMFSVDVHVRCARCRVRFRFLGCDMGLMPDRPMVSPDHFELRAPIVADAHLTSLMASDPDTRWPGTVPPVASSGEVPQSASVGLNALAKDVHDRNRKWWYAADGSPLARNKGELLMLIVTEVAEAMEGERKNLMDDKLPHRKMAEVELVDVIVRVLDYAGAFGYDLDGAYAEKLAFNATRSDHKAEAAKIAAGAGL